jgi:hypothetical protein
MEDLLARHSQMQAQAQTLQESADAWHKQMMWDKEMERKLAGLVSPAFLASLASLVFLASLASLASLAAPAAFSLFPAPR